MALRRKMPAPVQREVRRRARQLCEYCHTAEQWQYVPFTVDHVIPLNRGGSNTLGNLALACFHCNRRKSDHQIATDPVSGQPVPLFHPRTQAWDEHFAWSGDCLSLVGLTPQGRATVSALELNRERVIRLRSADYSIGRHPPEGDPVLGNPA